MGCIPICKRHPALRWFEHDSILFVDSWSQVTPELLAACPLKPRKPTPFSVYEERIKCAMLS